MKKAVGYTRLSTTMQLECPNSLEKQGAWIRESARARGFRLLGIYQDVGSAAREGSLAKRQDLLAALEEAKREGAILIVTDISRLFRNVKEATQTLATYDVDVFSLTDGRVVPRRTLLQQVKKAEDFARMTRDGTRRAMVNTDLNAGLEPGVAKTFASAKTRKIRSATITEEIADIIAEQPEHADLTRRELADLLNQRGIRSGHGNTWNEGSIRRQRAAAIRLIQEREEIERAVFDDVSHDAMIFSMVSPTVVGGQGDVDRVDESDEATEMEMLKKHPLFGMF